MLEICPTVWNGCLQILNQFANKFTQGRAITIIVAPEFYRTVELYLELCWRGVFLRSGREFTNLLTSGYVCASSRAVCVPLLAAAFPGHIQYTYRNSASAPGEAREILFISQFHLKA